MKKKSNGRKSKVKIGKVYIGQGGEAVKKTREYKPSNKGSILVMKRYNKALQVV